MTQKTRETLNAITEKTLFPLSVLLIMVAAAIQFTTIKNLAETNEKAIGELKEDGVRVNSKIFDRLQQMDHTLANISGKLEFITKKTP